MTFILHFRTSQEEKRSPKGLLSFHRVADAVIRVYDDAGQVIERTSAGRFLRVLKLEHRQPLRGAHPISKEILSKRFHPSQHRKPK
jgi:hypothetical protein